MRFTAYLTWMLKPSSMPRENSWRTPPARSPSFPPGQHGSFMQHFSRNRRPLGRVIIGVQLDPASGKEGARVLEVSPGGPAAEAGIQAGDVIVVVNGKDVTGEEASHRVIKIIRDVKPDSKLAVRVLRGAVTRDFTVTPRQRPNVLALAGGLPDLPALPVLRRSFMVDGPLSNMELATLTPRLGKYFGTETGVLVVRAPSDGALKLEDGDVILAIDGRYFAGADRMRHVSWVRISLEEKLTLRTVRERKTLELQTIVPGGVVGCCPDALKDRRDALSATDAQGCQAITPLTTMQLVNQLRDQYRAGGPHRMIHGNAVAIGVGLVRIEAQLARYRAARRGNSFIRLDDVEVRDREACAFEYLPRGRHRSHSHVGRPDARVGVSNQTRHRGQAAVLYGFGVRE